MNRIRSYGPSVVLVAVMSAAMLGGPFVMRQLAWAEQDARLDQARAELRNSPLAQLSNAFRDVAKAVEPSVVHIQVSRKAQAMGMGGPRGFDFEGPEGMDPNELFRRFFRDRYGMPDEAPGDEGEGEAPNRGQREQNDYNQYNPLQPSGSGSGWVYAHNGEHYIVTNNHVVEGADQVLVKFYDKTERIATVVGTDPQTDIAVLKVDNGSLHAAKLASEPVEQGDMVFAFGSPFSFEFSMSQGIVSGTSRQLGILRDVRGYEDFIQTDAAINPGNSGGPLTNIYGEVIGMNSAIATRTGAFNGLGFAIPTPMIKNVVTQIIDEGKVSRGYLGVWIKDLEDKLAKSFGFDGKGVLVEDVVDAESPAAKAGLEGGDIITEVNGKPVVNATELRSLVAMYQPGEKVKMKVFRNGDFTTKTVTLGELPQQQVAQGRIVPGRKQETVEPNKLEPLHKLGFEQMSTLTEELAEKNNLEVEGGVLVENVRPGSVADLQGLGRGAVILEVNGTAVETLESFAEEVGKLDLKQGVRMRVLLGGVKRFVFLELPEFAK